MESPRCTGTEQHITITSSTNMSKEDVDKAVREAEQFAAEDAPAAEARAAHVGAGSGLARLAVQLLAGGVEGLLQLLGGVLESPPCPWASRPWAAS